MLLFYCLLHKSQHSAGTEGFLEPGNGYLVEVLGEALNAVDVQAAVVHDSDHVTPAGAERHRGDGVLVGADVKQELACLSVDEAHDAVLAQHTQGLSNTTTQPNRRNELAR